MRNQVLVSDGFLALTVARFALLCSSLLAFACSLTETPTRRVRLAVNSVHTLFDLVGCRSLARKTKSLAHNNKC